MPTFKEVNCTFCSKKYSVPLKRFNESTKNNWNFYCSNKCFNNSKNTGKQLVCSNPICKKTFYRMLKDINLNNNFCSNSCSAIVTNMHRKRVLRLSSVKKVARNINESKLRREINTDFSKKCLNPSCSNLIKKRRKFCSNKCQGEYAYINGEEYKSTVITKIKDFYIKNKRIPYKHELYVIYHPARRAFGTWNKAIIAAGYIPNYEKFSKKYIAKDGHKCDSMSEKIIDDWLFGRCIPHQIHVHYPGQKKYKVDFVIDDLWIEFFGIYGELPKYTDLANTKINLAKELNLNFIKLFKSDIFPVNSLANILSTKFVNC